MLGSDEEGHAIRVRVTFTDDGGTEETLTSAATAAVAALPPLTAAFENVPAEHDGDAFTIRVRFSEAPAVGFSVLRDEAFAVTGGAVTRATRVDGRDDLREIHIQPAGTGDVSATLLGGRPCGGAGAVCTSDGRALSNSPRRSCAARRRCRWRTRRCRRVRGRRWRSPSRWTARRGAR